MALRLYHEDPYQLRFTAKVVEATPRGVVLDQTCFYPTGGGQPHDTGRLNGVTVLDVVEEAGKIYHVTDGPIVGVDVDGEIDWERRRDHMQQHHGQHLLSEAFVRVAQAPTESFHLGAETSSIELDKAVSPIDVERAETLSNQIVFDDRGIKIGYYTADQAAKLPLRKLPPPGEEKVRVIEVDRFDTQPCCGTHPRRTGEVGVVVVTGVEKKLVHFVCGFRALAFARRSMKTLRALSQKLSAPAAELEPAVERLLGEGNARFKELQSAEKELAKVRARDLAAAAKAKGRAKVVCEVFDGRDLKYLQALANEICAQPGMVAMLGGTGEKSSVVLAASKDLGLDLRGALQEALAVLGGKGGGQPHFVQGGGDGKDVRGALGRAETAIVPNL